MNTLDELKKENERLLAEVARYKTMSDNYCVLNMDAQSELTKARELLLDCANPESVGEAFANAVKIRAHLAHQSAPAAALAHNVDETCGQDAEAAKGGSHE